MHQRTLVIDINQDLIDNVREANDPSLETQEIIDRVDDFLSELDTPEGLSLILENLDYFNY